MCTVALAPRAFRVRVWAIVSPRPRGGQAVPEGASVAYALEVRCRQVQSAKCKVQVESEERTMLAVFSSPSRYTQGKNATAELGKEMKALGLEGPALIIAGRSALKLLSETWKQSLGVASIKHSVHPFGGECSLAEIERGKTEAKKQGARVIVGAG